jgi:hypothetical protein
VPTAPGHENLRKPNIAETIEKARAKRAERAELTGDMVISRVSAILGFLRFS